MNTDTQEAILSKTADYVRAELESDSTGHDWWHIYRVKRNAIIIAEQEGGDIFVIQLAALLHDIADWKFHHGDDSLSPRVAEQWLNQCGVDEVTVAHVTRIIREMNFRGAAVETKLSTLEGKVVQDADWLEALGAIGIARTFAYGGFARRAIYDPCTQPHMHTSFEEYASAQGPTINHFYEKLLLLRDRMNTDTGRALAKRRHEFMESFLAEFFSEWDGKSDAP